jgi:hypothetical protein
MFAQAAIREASRVQSIATAHAARVTLERAARGGLRAVVRFAAADAAPAAQRREPSPASTGPNPRLTDS